MLNSREIIILNLIKHSEKGLVVQCYSLQKGRESLYFKGGGKNRQLLLSLHKLALMDCIVFCSNGSSMPTIKEVSIAHQLNSIRTNIYKSSIAIFISELILKTIKEEEPNDQIFGMLSSSIKILDAIDEGASNFHLFFMVNLSRVLGFMPYSVRGSRDDLFYIPSGRFERQEVALFQHGAVRAEDMWFSKGESDLMEQLLKCKITECNSIRCSGELRYEFAKKMIKYISYHLEYDLEIKSLEVLHEIFS